VSRAEFHHFLVGMSSAALLFSAWRCPEASLTWRLFCSAVAGLTFFWPSRRAA
jgi:hypothetical protein